MAVLFISHSSRDDPHASAVERWLRDNGFTDIFVDHENITGGEKWREALRQAANSCRVVVCIVTGNWLSSAECFAEFMAAWYMGRRVIPLLLLPEVATLGAEERKRLDRVWGEDQGIDIAPCIDNGGALNVAADPGVAGRFKSGLRAAGANTRIGLDPAEFPIDKTLREFPFPGLASFGDEDADAALFYGRSREIAHVLEDLRSMRALNDLRPLVIQGASGAGKSSLLKAGIIPRLRRETPAWLPLRAFRPGADPLLNFAEALARTLGDYGQREAHGVLRDRLRKAWDDAARVDGKLSEQGLAMLQEHVEVEGQRLRKAADRPGATILISVDQAEELARTESDSAEALADYLRAAFTSTQSHWLLAFTIRTDSLPELQRHRRFEHLEARGYDLRAVPNFHFDRVVEQPAKRYGVEVDVTLIDALMDDAPKEDALPLLAFALQRLWRQYAASGSLTEMHYKNFGGLNGLIEDAAERALRGLEPDQDVPLPQREPSPHILRMGQTTFVPAMVQINDQGAPIRRTPAWKSFSHESQELLERFDRWRIVVRRGQDEQDGGTAEIAHEALFRTWKRLEEWLRPERARLEALRYLQLDAMAWKRKGEDALYLNHRDTRLAECEALATDATFAAQIGEDERNYLLACRTAQRRRRTRMLLSKAALGCLVLLLIGTGAGWYWQDWVVRKYHWNQMQPDPLSAQREKEIITQHGRKFSECGIGCPTLVVVPAGSLTMGTDDRSENERPVRAVTIAAAFAIGETEVTIAQWDKCVEAGACPKLRNPRREPDDLPVVNVKWSEVQLYVGWLRQMTGKPYRLPTEAEWEYAARGNRKGLYSFGDDPKELRKYAWYADNATDTRSVGSLAPNDFSLKDMHGNVFEFCEDPWHKDYSGNPPADQSVWPGGESGKHVVRGGAWDSLAIGSRLTYRSPQDDNADAPNVGFRIARSLGASP